MRNNKVMELYDPSGVTLANANRSLYCCALTYLSAGRPDAFQEDANFYVTDDQFSYVYAIALDGVGANEKAIAELERTLKQRPYDRRMLSALISFLDKAGQKKKADEYRARL